MTEKMAAFTDGDEWDYRFEKSPRCPHCGTAHDVSDRDWTHLYEEGEHEVECPTCDLGFTVYSNVSFSFSTDEQGDGA